ncbi:hypothetical protein B0H11DRAFT_1912005 [Mycena galericulata]|nr:hypothetical protein B0H11DRAFT_1912005 [Mycena galericulata]
MLAAGLAAHMSHDERSAAPMVVPLLLLHEEVAKVAPAALYPAPASNAGLIFPGMNAHLGSQDLNLAPRPTTLGLHRARDAETIVEWNEDAMYSGIALFDMEAWDHFDQISLTGLSNLIRTESVAAANKYKPGLRYFKTFLFWLGDFEFDLRGDQPVRESRANELYQLPGRFSVNALLCSAPPRQTISPAFPGNWGAKSCSAMLRQLHINPRATFLLGAPWRFQPLCCIH